MSEAPPSAWLPPAALLCASLVGSAWIGTRPADPSAPVAALFPPWWSAREAASAAASSGGSVLRFGGLPGLVVTRSADPGFAARLRAAGAWLLLNPRAAGLCGGPNERDP